MKPKSALRSFLLAGSSLLAAPTLFATPLYWDGNTTTLGAGNTTALLNRTWGSFAAWNTDSTGGGGGALQTATANTDDLYFVAGPSATSGNVNYTVALGSAQVANSLNFQTQAQTTINSSTITLGNGTANAGGINVAQFAYGSTAQGLVNISTSIILNNAQTWANNAANKLTIGGAVNLNGNRLTFLNSGTNLTEVGAGGVISGAGGITVTSGRVTLGGGQSPAHTYSGDTNLNGGVTSFSGTTTNNISVNSNININGGILESYWTNGFAQTLGAGANQIRITDGESGFSLNGNTGATVNLGGGAITWGSANFAPTKLLLQSAFSQGASALAFANNLDLNGGDRTILVNGGTTGIARAELTGVISNSTGTAGLTKEGTGNLFITTNAATSGWNGATTVSGGILHLGAVNLANIGGGSGRNISVASGAAIGINSLSNAGLNRIVETAAEISVLTSATSSALDFSSSTGANLPGAFLGSNFTNGGKAEISGIITPGGGSYRLGAPGLLQAGTLGITQTSLLSGANGLIIGGNRVVIVGTHTFTGDTTLRDGARLGLAGLNTDAGAAKNNSLALQNSVLDLGAPASTGLLFLEASTTAGAITGATTSANGGTKSATFGGLKGSRNLNSAFLFTGPGNNTSATTAANITGFTLNTGTGVTVTYSGAIGGFGAVVAGSTGGNSTLTKTGDGTQELGGANSYSGVTTISGGTLKLGHATALGFGGRSSVSTGETTVATGATLGLNGVTGVNEPISLSGDGFGGIGALVNNSGSPAGIDNGVASLLLPGASTGSGYSTAPTVTIAGTGSGATAVASLGVTDANFALNVSGDRIYTVAPTIAITGGGGSGATATPILSGVTTGTVTGVTITSPGSGYTTVPTATVSGGTSTGATTTTFTGNATNFTVSAVAVTTAGSGYTGTPTYSFDSGNATPGNVIVSSVVLAADSSIGGTGDTIIAAAVSETGGARALTKVGAGTFTLAGTNTYSGDTTVTGGTLGLGAINASNELSTVTIGTSAIMKLTFAGTDTVNKLFIGATQQPAGLYGHSSTGANNGGQGVGVLDARFAIGSGTLTVTTGSGGGPTGFAAWQLANSTGGALDADHDNDGVDNGTEYFLGGNTSTTGFTALPGVTNTAGTLSVTWDKAAIGYAGNYTTDFVVETSDTLIGAWTTAVLGVGADTVEITGSAVKYTFPSGTKKFARLKVTGP